MMDYTILLTSMGDVSTANVDMVHKAYGYLFKGNTIHKAISEHPCRLFEKLMQYKEYDVKELNEDHDIREASALDTAVKFGSLHRYLLANFDVLTEDGTVKVPALYRDMKSMGFRMNYYLLIKDKFAKIVTREIMARIMLERKGRLPTVQERYNEVFSIRSRSTKHDGSIASIRSIRSTTFPITTVTTHNDNKDCQRKRHTVIDGEHGQWNPELERNATEMVSNIFGKLRPQVHTMMGNQQDQDKGGRAKGTTQTFPTDKIIDAEYQRDYLEPVINNVAATVLAAVEKRGKNNQMSYDDAYDYAKQALHDELRRHAPNLPTHIQTPPVHLTRDPMAHLESRTLVDHRPSPMTNTRTSSGKPDFTNIGETYGNRSITKRAPIDSKIMWDGRDDSFPNFQRRVEAWMKQIGISYMLLPQFIQAYQGKGGNLQETEGGNRERPQTYDDPKTYGWMAARDYAGDVHGHQFLHDVHVLYGAIESCISADGRGSRWISKIQDNFRWSYGMD
jgi:hypothetical protein